MTLHRLIGLSIISILAGCDSDAIPGPPASLNYAVATYECIGPLSESGVAIYLATTPIQSLKPLAPYARIVLRPSVDRLTEQPWLVAEPGTQASASLTFNGTDHEFATSGAVTIDAVVVDSSIEGWADLFFPNAGRVTGNFRASWLPPTQFCI